ncbi:MAG TPA: ABC transporter permease [Terriglobia bacterium]|nr:ABC transporter permease [Terriglobia bacterium]
MKLARMLYHLARADFLERVRRYNFLITLGFIIYLGYIFVPPAHSRYATMEIGGHRGVYNSAYVGSAVAMLTAVFLSLIGFYLVKNAIDRDLQTRVGQILATTPLTKREYTMGKALSNFAVLAVMVGVMFVAAGVMQLVRGEDMTIHPFRLLAPFLLIDLPVLAVVAAVAILFETVSWLRRGFGNVSYFFLWTAALSIPMAAHQSLGGHPLDDLIGSGILLPDLIAACGATYPGCGNNGNISMGLNFKEAGQYFDLTTFRWEGIHWAPEIILGRLMWLLVAVVIAGMAAFFFSRFDPAREGLRLTREQKRARGQENVETSGGLAAAGTLTVSLTPLARNAGGNHFARLVLSELRLMLKGQSRWWYAVAAGLLVASAAIPYSEARQALAGLAWIWPVLIWSQMGAREARHATESLVFSSERALYRQLPAAWVAGVVVAVLTGGGYGLRLLIGGDARGFAAWCLAALFIPSLSLAFGVWSGSSKLFEVIYTLWWYMGPMSHAPGINFLSSSLSNQSLAFYLVATTTLLVAAFLGRRTQLGYA